MSVKGAKPAAGPAKGVVPAKPAGRVPPPSLKPPAGKGAVAPPKGAPPKPGVKVDAKTSKGDVKGPPVGPKQRYSVMSADAMAASRAAAAKLAAAAGLHPVKSTSNGDAPARNYTRVTKSPFDKKELAEFREMLLIKRRQIEGDVNAMETEALSGGGGSLSHLPQHMADQGTDTFDQSLALDLAASQRGLLKEIDAALARIEAGTYGICEEMGKPITVERLRHTPWARFCIEAARLHERGALSR
jgi:RNA polymerase-binding protein DksA